MNKATRIAFMDFFGDPVDEKDSLLRFSQEDQEFIYSRLGVKDRHQLTVYPMPPGSFHDWMREISRTLEVRESFTYVGRTLFLVQEYDRYRLKFITLSKLEDPGKERLLIYPSS